MLGDRHLVLGEVKQEKKVSSTIKKQKTQPEKKPLVA